MSQTKLKHTVRVTEQDYKRIFDRRDAQLKSAGNVVSYALDCMEEKEQQGDRTT